MVHSVPRQCHISDHLFIHLYLTHFYCIIMAEHVQLSSSNPVTLVFSHQTLLQNLSGSPALGALSTDSLGKIDTFCPMFCCISKMVQISDITTTRTVLRPFFRDHAGEPVPEENFWTLWCKGRLTGRHTDHPAGCHSIRTNHCPPPPSPHFLQARCPSCRPTNSVKALKATSAFGLGRRR